MKRYWDLSMPLADSIVVWPGDERVRLHRYMSIEGGDEANVSRADFGVHSGTHVDAPCHFVSGGRGVDEIPLEVLIGEVVVVDFPGRREITSADLAVLELPAGTRRLLLKTDNSRRRLDTRSEFASDFSAITADAAQWLVEHGIVLVGIDYLSIQLYADDTSDTHRVLLGADVVIVEGLVLRDVPVGSFQLICLPIKLVGADGAPARVVLIEDRESLR